MDVSFTPDDDFIHRSTSEAGHVRPEYINTDADDDKESDRLLDAAVNYDPSVPADLHLFRESQADAEYIFSERRKKYGSHLDNARRFPFEDKAGLYLKCVRTIRMIENRVELDDDTLIDLANYCHLIRSSRGGI